MRARATAKRKPLFQRSDGPIAQRKSLVVHVTQHRCASSFAAYVRREGEPFLMCIQATRCGEVHGWRLCCDARWAHTLRDVQ
jgi:hypothetical protein